MLEVNQLIGFGAGGISAPIWRLNFPSGSVQTTTAISEIEMAGNAGGIDLCNGGTATASSSGATRSADKAFNGITAYPDMWESAGDGACWIQYEFLENVSINEIRITVAVGAPNFGPSVVEVQISQNGINFSTLWTFNLSWLLSVETKTLSIPSW